MDQAFDKMIRKQIKTNVETLLRKRVISWILAITIRFIAIELFVLYRYKKVVFKQHALSVLIKYIKGNMVIEVIKEEIQLIPKWIFYCMKMSIYTATDFLLH